MSKLQRDNLPSKGWTVAQFFDVKHWTERVYDYTRNLNIPVEYAARYTWAFLGGVPRLQHAPDTSGPVGQLICWPPIKKGGRTLAQWGGGFFAQITDVGPPIMATPVHDAVGGVAALEPGLAPMIVTMLDGSTPSLKDFVWVGAGTDLSAQQAIAFKGGGDTTFLAKIQSASGLGVYTFAEIDPVTNVVMATGGRSGSASETNRATTVDNNTVVTITTRGGAYYFEFAVGPCT